MIIVIMICIYNCTISKMVQSAVILLQVNHHNHFASFQKAIIKCNTAYFN